MRPRHPNGAYPLQRPVPSSLPPKDVHVIVLGWEYDRAVLPFQTVGGKPPTFLPHRVHLIVPNPTNARGYDDRVRETLEKITEVVYVPLKMDGHDFEILMRTMLDICRRETAEGNRVHINMSAGSRLSALVGGLVGMALLDEASGSTYYVRPMDYPVDDDDQDAHGLSMGMRDVQLLPRLRLIMPTPGQLRVLAVARSRPDWTVTLHEVALHLAENENEGEFRVLANDRASRNDKSRALINLRRRYLLPLEEQGFIRSYKEGRIGKVQMLKKGELYALLAPEPAKTPVRTR